MPKISIKVKKQRGEKSNREESPIAATPTDGPQVNAKKKARTAASPETAAAAKIQTKPKRKAADDSESGVAAAAAKKPRASAVPASTHTPMVFFKRNVTVVTGLDGETLAEVAPRPKAKGRKGKGKGKGKGAGDAAPGSSGGGNSGGSAAAAAASGTPAAGGAASGGGDDTAAAKLSNKQRKRLRDKKVRAAHKAGKKKAAEERGGNVGSSSESKDAGDEDAVVIDDGAAVPEKKESAEELPDAIILPKAVRRVIIKREKARLLKDWDTADALREALVEDYGVEVYDKTRTFRLEDKRVTGSYASLVVKATESVDPSAVKAAKEKAATTAKLKTEASGDDADADADDGQKGGNDNDGEKKLTPAEARKMIDRVNIAKEEIPGTVFIRNLPLDVDQVELEDMLGQYGTVTSCRLVVDKQTRQPNGTAFADYESEGHAKTLERFCRKKGIRFAGKNITVKMALSHTGVRAIQEGRTTRPTSKETAKNKQFRKKNRGLKRAGKRGAKKGAAGGREAGANDGDSE